MGQQHAEWIGVAPFLEEDLAFCSIAQDELGHAAALYEVLGGGGDADQLAFRRAPQDYRSCHLVELPCPDWSDALVRHWLYDEAEVLRWDSLASSSWPTVAAVVERRVHDHEVEVGEVEVAHVGPVEGAAWVGDGDGTVDIYDLTHRNVLAAAAGQSPAPPPEMPDVDPDNVPIAQLTGLTGQVTVVRGRAEEQVGLLSADVVTARAVAPLDRLAGWCLPLASPGGRLLALKGVSAADEIAEHGDAVARLGGGPAVIHQCGVGLIDPPDDHNLANPPSNPQLLDYLATGFRGSGYDMKWLHREIANSHTYQCSWQITDSNRHDERNLSHAILRRLPAEVVHDALRCATAIVPTASSRSNCHPRRKGPLPTAAHWQRKSSPAALVSSCPCHFGSFLSAHERAEQRR